MGQRYDSTGAPAGLEFRVNTYTTNSQGLPSVAGHSGGHFVVVWHSSGQDGSSYGVFGQRFCPALSSVTISVSGTTTVCTGTSYLINGANFPPAGGFFCLVCATFPECGTATFSNEVLIVVNSDTTAPSVTPPSALTTTQTLCL